MTLLMVSRIPTVSTKHMKVPVWMFIPLMLVVVWFASSVITQPWFTLGVATLVYALTIPLVIVIFLKEKSEYNKNADK